MPTSSPLSYGATALTRSEVDAMPGTLLLQFGVGWCGHCQAAEPAIVQALRAYPQLRHLRIEDGAGRTLGRSFRVKLWPTLVLVAQGQELTRLVRPTQVEQLDVFLRQLPNDV
jgi:thioredoxin 1